MALKPGYQFTFYKCPRCGRRISTAHRAMHEPACVKAAAARAPRPPDCGNRGCGRCVACRARAYRAEHGKPLESWENWPVVPVERAIGGEG